MTSCLINKLFCLIYLNDMLWSIIKKKNRENVKEKKITKMETKLLRQRMQLFSQI